MSKFEDLARKTVEKDPSRARAKGKRLRKGKQSDDEKGSSELSSESKSELEQQVDQKEKRKNQD